MQLKLNNRGVTLVELLVAVSLIAIVLGSAYMFMHFSYHSFADTEASFDIGDDARISLMKIEKNIRTAQDVMINKGRHLAVEVQDDGNTLNVYTDINDDDVLEMVKYKLVDASLVMGEAIPGSEPSEWFTVVDSVENKVGEPIFDINGSRVIIKLYVADESRRFKDKPVCVEASFSVRSKEAMKNESS
jgi:prepilin-type N-terminal cleavage/methylation domain-containing protein